MQLLAGRCKVDLYGALPEVHSDPIKFVIIFALLKWEALLACNSWELAM